MFKEGIEQISYSNPAENLEKDDEPIHSFDLTLDGKIIGRAEITYYSKPFPLYQVSELFVEPEFQGEGRAGKIMEQVELFLKKKRKAGVIVDAIHDDSPAKGMYARRGWQEVKGEGGLFVYNLPKNAIPSDLNGYAFR